MKALDNDISAAILCLAASLTIAAVSGCSSKVQDSPVSAHLISANACF